MCFDVGAHPQWPLSWSGGALPRPVRAGGRGHMNSTRKNLKMRFLAFPCVSSCFLDPTYVLAYKTSCFHDRTCVREAHIQTHTGPGHTLGKSCDRICDRSCDSSMLIGSITHKTCFAIKLHYTLCMYMHRSTLIYIYICFLI